MSMRAGPVTSAKAPVLLLSSNDVGGAGQIELLFRGVDVQADPEFVADADVVVVGRPDLGGKRCAGALVQVFRHLHQGVGLVPVALHVRDGGSTFVAVIALVDAARVRSAIS
jgi:hypothetical protein